ncbi:MAG: hypothetical protein Ta2F_12190 [Termitinemataceae bacterium]|nr:MAG: hypothetical protein Ta2F_12190 [Termitinemataceae bacterium]
MLNKLLKHIFTKKYLDREFSRLSYVQDTFNISYKQLKDWLFTEYYDIPYWSYYLDEKSKWYKVLQFVLRYKTLNHQYLTIPLMALIAKKSISFIVSDAVNYFERAISFFYADLEAKVPIDTLSQKEINRMIYADMDFDDKEPGNGFHFDYINYKGIKCRLFGGLL